MIIFIVTLRKTGPEKKLMNFFTTCAEKTVFRGGQVKKPTGEYAFLEQYTGKLKMQSENIISLLTLCATIGISVTTAAVWICSKLEKINLAITTLVTRKECLENRSSCPAVREKKRKRKSY